MDKKGYTVHHSATPCQGIIEVALIHRQLLKNDTLHTLISFSNLNLSLNLIMFTAKLLHHFRYLSILNVWIFYNEPCYTTLYEKEKMYKKI